MRVKVATTNFLRALVPEATKLVMSLQASMNLSTACLALGEQRGAVAAARSAVKLQLGFAPALLALGRAHM